MKLDAYGEPMLQARKRTPRNSVPDQSKLILWPLMPLLAVNAATWRFYTGNGVVAALWFVAFIACIFWARKS